MIDFGLWGALTPTSLEHMVGQWQEGAMGFKAFIPYSDPSYPNASDDDLLRGMQIAAAKDALVLVHCENDDILQANRARLKAAGRSGDLMAHPESRPPFTEEEAAHRALYIARQAGARLQVVHTSSPETLEVIIAIAGTMRPPLLSIVADMASNTRARGMRGKLVIVKRSAALAGTTNR